MGKFNVMKKMIAFLLLLSVLLAACIRTPSTTSNPADILRTPVTAVPETGGSEATSTSKLPPTATPEPYAPKIVPSDQKTKDGIPVFEHIIVMMFENTNYDAIIGNENLPNFNRLLQDNVAFSQYYGLSHPSLPNYIGLLGGDTFGINSDCFDCYLNKVSLPDLIDKAGYTWKTYQEDMPGPCFLKHDVPYDLNHDPFVYFDSIRNDKARCDRSVVPMTVLDSDLSHNRLPNFAFIMPNICNSGHDCDLSVSDDWLGKMIGRLTSSPALGDNYAIFFLFDESEHDHSACCGLQDGQAGGQVVAGMISPRAKAGFVDDTPMTNYGLLKTILTSWDLPDLGYTSNPETKPITRPWK